MRGTAYQQRVTPRRGACLIPVLLCAGWLPGCEASDTSTDAGAAYDTEALGDGLYAFRLGRRLLASWKSVSLLEQWQRGSKIIAPTLLALSPLWGNQY